MRVLLGLGDGTFRALSSGADVPISSSFGGDTFSRFITAAAADVDGDGQLGLVSAARPSAAGFLGGAAVLLGRGDGAFAAATVFPFYDPFNRFQPVTVAVGEASGDGILDVLVGLVVLSSTSPFTTSVLVGRGDGTFETPLLNPGPIPIAASSIPPRLAADVNTDGILDLVRLAASPGSTQPTTLQVALGRGDGTFSPYATATPVALPGGFGERFVLGDVNNDDQLDAIVWQVFPDHGGVSARLLLGSGDGSFGAPAVALSNASNFIQYELADVNGDGKLDLVRQGAFANLVVNLGDGVGGFGPDISSGQAQIGFSATGFLLADVNGDGGVWTQSTPATGPRSATAPAGSSPPRGRSWGCPAA